MPTSSTARSTSLVASRADSSRGCRISSIRISAGGMRNGPKTFGSWKKARAAVALRQQLGTGQRAEQREHPDHGRCDRRGEVGAHEQPRAPAEVM